MSFEPFAVQCLTCGSQLRVSNPALVGTISQCPKCGSMVQVDPPEQPIAVGDAPVDSEAITEESVQHPGALPEAAAPVAPFGDAPAPPLPQSEPLAAAPLDWQSERTARTRQIALVVAVSLSGLLAATLMFGWFVYSWRQDSASLAAANPADATAADAASDEGDRSPETPGPADAQTDRSPESGGPERGGDDAEADGAEETGGALSGTRPVDEDAGGEASADGTDAVDDRSPTPAKGTPQETSEPEAEAAANDSPAIPDGLLPEDPLSIALGREDASAETPKAGEADAAGELQELPPGLRQFTPFLDQPGAQRDVEPTLDPPSTIEDIELEQAAEDRLDPMMIANPPEPIDMDRALAVEIAVDTRGYPLTDFALLISQVTGVPIQVDWLSFDLAGIDVAGAVTPPGGGWKSAAELLDAIAASRGAEVVRRESLLEVTVAEEAFAKEYDALVGLDDFAGDRQAAAALLDRFLAGAPDGQEDAPDVDGGAPAGDQPEGEGDAGEDAAGDVLASADTPRAEEMERSEVDSGKRSASGSAADAAEAGDDGSRAGRLVEEASEERWRPPGQTRQQRQLAALAVDTLRRMRGLEPKIPDERFRRWAAPASSASAGWPRLDGGNAGPQYDAPITMAELLRRTARGNGATCLVNWYDVRRRRVSPEQLTMPYTGEPAAEMLQRTLDPFGLQVRQVDPRHWWVGTAATYDRLPVVVWTEPLGEQRERFRERLDQAMAGASRGTYRFVHDPVSDRALLLLPRFVLAQLDKIRQPEK